MTAPTDPAVALYRKIADGEARLFDPALTDEARTLLELQLEGMRKDLEKLLDIPTVLLLTWPQECAKMKSEYYQGILGR